MAACDIRENGYAQLSEIADQALDYLNGLEDGDRCCWEFDDNSLYLRRDEEGEA